MAGEARCARENAERYLVYSKDELSEHIYCYFSDINIGSVVCHWTYKMDKIDPDEAQFFLTFSVVICHIVNAITAPIK